VREKPWPWENAIIPDFDYVDGIPTWEAAVLMDGTPVRTLKQLWEYLNDDGTDERKHLVLRDFTQTRRGQFDQMPAPLKKELEAWLKSTSS
jgi:hypothetical protein